MEFKKRFKISSFQWILIGFGLLILLGSLLLIFPFSSKDRVWTSFIDCLFTSTSAVCVTGLVVFDTATHWSIFGQIIILILIQIGGLGVIVVAISLALITGKKIGLAERDTIKEAISAPELGGVMKMVKFIIITVGIIELTGTLIMIPVFCIDYGAIGIWYAIFHSISAFCNAGFDILGTTGYSSLTFYSANAIINIVIMLLIIIGGIGFFVWNDIYKYKLHFSRYRLQTKVVLILTIFLIMVPAIYFFIAEFSDKAFGERVLLSLFQSVTTRTAGFNTANLQVMSHIGVAIMIGLMLIGGSSGSTAGGMKTTTFAVLLFSTISVFRRKKETVIMKRRVDDSIVRSASAIFLMYMGLFIFSALIISGIEGFKLADCLFETASAIGTVGLTLGITPMLSIPSKLIIIFLMYFGRAGGLTFIYATLRSSNIQANYPQEKIMVG